MKNNLFTFSWHFIKAYQKINRTFNESFPLCSKLFKSSQLLLPKAVYTDKLFHTWLKKATRYVFGIPEPHWKMFRYIDQIHINWAGIEKFNCVRPWEKRKLSNQFFFSRNIWLFKEKFNYAQHFITTSLWDRLVLGSTINCVLERYKLQLWPKTL